MARRAADGQGSVVSAARRAPYVPARGDIVWLDFDPQRGREQAGRRPALVLSPLKYNRRGLMLACPVTSKSKEYPFEVPLDAGKITGCALADHVKNQDWQGRKAVYVAKAPEAVVRHVTGIVALLLTEE